MSYLLSRFANADNRPLTEKLVFFIGQAEDKDLFHIDVYALADSWNEARVELLELFIYGLHEGVFRMDWQYHCPHCGGVASESLTLHTAKHESYCDLCKVNFTNKLDDNIEVFFSIHPEVRSLSAEIAAAYRAKMMEDLETGQHFLWRKDSTIFGSDIILNPVYRELMGEEVLLEDQSLEIMKTTILFTDIRGSTRLYTDLGDARAFQLVREHFIVLFDTIRKHHGVPVKTIGDAVMGSFARQADALSAALEAQKILIERSRSRPENEKIEVKIGMHTGTTLIVTLNGKLDYFGSTVNMAARIQGIARTNEVVVSEPIFKETANRPIMAGYTSTVSRTRATFKGMDGEYTLYRIPVS